MPDNYDGCIEDAHDNPTSNSIGKILKNGQEEHWGQWKPSVLSRESERVYHAVWFPLMDSGDPVSCCFASSSR